MNRRSFIFAILYLILTIFSIAGTCVSLFTEEIFCIKMYLLIFALSAPACYVSFRNS